MDDQFYQGLVFYVERMDDPTCLRVMKNADVNHKFEFREVTTSLFKLACMNYRSGLVRKWLEEDRISQQTLEEDVIWQYPINIFLNPDTVKMFIKRGSHWRHLPSWIRVPYEVWLLTLSVWRSKMPVELWKLVYMVFPKWVPYV